MVVSRCKTWMVLALAYASAALTARGQTVAIQNVSYPGTALEVGEYVGISIVAAAPNAPVTVVQNGASPYFFGYTDDNGDWSITSYIDSSYANLSFTQQWYVNGVQLTPANPDSTYLRYAPNLPSFTINANYTGNTCPAQSTVVYCGSGPANRWYFTPLPYYSYSSTVTGDDVSGAVDYWNSVQSQISLAEDSSRWVVQIEDGTQTSVPGMTSIYGGDCTVCSGYLDLCQGFSPLECIGAAGAYNAYVELEPNDLGSSASALQAAGESGATEETLATISLMHELGHVLRLADVAASLGRCSEVQSIMYNSLSVLYGCGRTSPTTSCDGAVLTNTVYATPPNTCSPLGTNYCSSEYPCS